MKKILAGFIIIFISWLWSSALGKNESAEYMLKEDLSIGVSMGEDHLMFGGILDVGLDSQQNIYIFDARNLAIRKFDPEGGYISSLVLKHGQGPGEISQASSMAVMPDGVCFLYDLGTKKILKFNAAGEYQKSFQLDFQAMHINPYTGQQIAVLGLNDDQIIHIYDVDGGHHYSFGEPFEVPSSLSQYKEMPMLKSPMRFDGNGAGRLYCLNPHKYEIRIYQDGKLERTISAKSEHFKPLFIGKSDQGGLGLLFPTLYIFEYKEFLYAGIRGLGRDPVHHLDIFRRDKKTDSLSGTGLPYAVDSQGRLYFSVEDEYPRMVRCQVIRNPTVSR